MIEYRPFRNADPPNLVELWHACSLGRGAARDFSYDAFDTLNFSQAYFDPAGLILACDGDQMVGCVHCGFGCNKEETELSTDTGVICAVMVRPQYRRTGIGRKLISLAEHHFENLGTPVIYAGPSPHRDPFYFGLYGGSQPSGFLESDPSAAPFMQALGYEPVERHLVFQRQISDPKDPVSFRWSKIRRRTELEISAQPANPSWWWMTRFGRLDSLQFQLIPKEGGAPLAQVTALGLDLYISRWQHRTIGLTGLIVTEPERRRGYGQALLIETIRRLRQEMVTQIEAHVPASNQPAIELFESTGFTNIDAGVVYRLGRNANLAGDDHATNTEKQENPQSGHLSGETTIVLGGG